MKCAILKLGLQTKPSIINMKPAPRTAQENIIQERYHSFLSTFLLDHLLCQTEGCLNRYLFKLTQIMYIAGHWAMKSFAFPDFYSDFIYRQTSISTRVAIICMGSLQF